MKTKEEIETRIRNLEHDFRHILTGSLATVAINAPRAICQVQAESELFTLYWVLGRTFKSKLKGIDR